MSLYDNIKKIAKSKGYSINKLEQELGFARSYISKFKTITPGADKLQQIAEFLDISVDYLMRGEREINTDKNSSSETLRLDSETLLYEYELTVALYIAATKNNSDKYEKYLCKLRNEILKRMESCNI